MTQTDQLPENSERVAQWEENHVANLTHLMTTYHHPHVMSVDYTDNELGVRTAVDELADIPMTLEEALDAKNTVFQSIVAVDHSPEVYNSRFREFNDLVTYARLKKNGMNITHRPSADPAEEIKTYLELVAMGGVNETAEQQLAAHIARYYSQKYYAEYGAGQFLYEMQRTFSSARPKDKALKPEHHLSINKAMDRLRVLIGIVDKTIEKPAEDIQPWIDENRGHYQELLADYAKREEAENWKGSYI